MPREADPLILPAEDARSRPGLMVEARAGAIADALLLACCHGGSRSGMRAITPTGDQDGLLLWRGSQTTGPLGLSAEEEIAA